MQPHLNYSNQNMNAQEGNANLLPCNTRDWVNGLLHEFQTDWRNLGEDPAVLQEFIMKECNSMSRSMVRVAFIIDKVEEDKVYKKFGYKSTTAMMQELFGMCSSTVSRMRKSYPYLVAVSEVLPGITLNESKFRELRRVVDADKSLVTEKDKIARAIVIVKEISIEKGDKITAADIRAKASQKSKSQQPKKEFGIIGKELANELSTAVEGIYRCCSAGFDFDEARKRLDLVLEELGVVVGEKEIDDEFDKFFEGR